MHIKVGLFVPTTSLYELPLFTLHLTTSISVNKKPHNITHALLLTPLEFPDNLFAVTLCALSAPPVRGPQRVLTDEREQNTDDERTL